MVYYSHICTGAALKLFYAEIVENDIFSPYSDISHNSNAESLSRVSIAICLENLFMDYIL